MAKLLTALAELVNITDVKGNLNLAIEHIHYDSRDVRQNSLFICLSGQHVDGHDFAIDAVNKGAVAVLAERDIPELSGVTIILTSDTRIAMQLIAPWFFEFPARSLRVIGITGTNGKTTTTYLLRSILRAAGYRVGVIGTIQTLIDDRVLPVKNTTPDVIDLQRILRMMVDAGLDYVVMEVSSHALALNRVAGCEFDVGIFSNLTQDHLDFHGTIDDYARAKSKLFAMLSLPTSSKHGKTAIINLDDPAATLMLTQAQCPLITYAIDSTAANLKANQLQLTSRGARFAVNGCLEYSIQLNLTGRFNVYNALAAIAAGLAEKIDIDIIAAGLEAIESVPGRFERVDAGQPFTVLVDYAHTPDGLENVLKTARQVAVKRVIVVFGCGGDRDPGKRPIMGKLAAMYADVIIATSDNPRSEDPLAILAAVEQGIHEGLRKGGTYQVIADRGTAIATALKLALPDDVVLIAGKGHETYQILKDRTIDFDDREVVRQVIKEMNHG